MSSSWVGSMLSLETGSHISAGYRPPKHFHFRTFSLASVPLHLRSFTFFRNFLSNFIVPSLAIRDRHQGYAVSIIKAGLTAVGRHGGRVRPPLTDLTEHELNDLTELVRTVSPSAIRRHE